MISGERVRQVRELLGLTQAQLAEKLEIDQSAVGHIEAGRSQASETVLERLSLRTGFPVGFFMQGPPPEFPMGSLLFRSLRSTTSRERTEARRYGELAYECASLMAQRVKIAVPLRVPKIALDAPRGITPATAAEHARDAFGLSPNTPIQHLVNTLERGGVLVLALPLRLEKRDAFSLWAGDAHETPVIVLSGDVPGDRLRFSIAHELGHLIMHQPIRGNLPDLETEAQAFASELLLPRGAMENEMHPPITLTTLSQLKPRWQVSIQALVMRARELEVITNRQAKYLFQQIGGLGWRTVEPIEIPIEKPRAFRKLAEELFGKPVNITRLSSSTNKLGLDLAKRFLEAHATRDELPSTPSGRVATNIVELRPRPA